MQQEEKGEQVARLGAERGTDPARDLIPAPGTFLASITVEEGDVGDTDPDLAAVAAALHQILGRTPRPWCGPALDAALAGLDPDRAPVQAVRLAAAVAAGLLAGHLPPGMPWALHIVDPTGAAAPALGPVFDLLGGLLDAWDATAAPPAVLTNLGSLRRAGAAYEPVTGRLTTIPDLWIELDPGSWRDRGGDPARDAPTVTVRPAPAGKADPGPPPPAGLPPHPGPALSVAAHWCFGRSEAEDVDRITRLLAGGAPSPDGCGWEREAADLELAAHPDQPGAWCRRALVEARHPAGSRARHRRLVEAAVGTTDPAPDLRRHAGELRGSGRAAWALDIWAVADRTLRAQLVDDVLHDPSQGHLGELALSLATRVEEAAIRCRLVVPSQTEG